MTADEKPRRRRLPDDHLWHSVTRSVVPLKRRQATRLDAGLVERQDKAVPRRAQGAPVRPAAALKSSSKSSSKLSSKPSPPLMPIDRRLKQRLARGRIEIDGRLDLHGRTQSEAHAALLRFLHRAQGDGARTVLVITGKGGADAGRGVLNRQVPLWLALPEFRAYVLGVEAAHAAHGGEGALYVRLRRRR
jgi:DNA-nicking Smr family endonuclease